ncbi:uncharacterized protein [Apostichopus japonicus]|uniref:uncharacterized protein isoform X1 n=1 Tax=Stichopus japonicus TaxID=307972 RepID=UPI003AB8C442
MEIDGIFDKLGRIGKFQVLIYIFCGLQGISFPVWDMLSVTSFMAPSSEYSCRTIATEDENVEDFTGYIANNSSLTNEICEDGEVMVFNLDTYGRTMVSEWQLVGDKAVLVELSQSLFMVGMMVGSIVLGQMSDSFGRKPILVMCVTLSPLFGLASGFVPNIWLFAALRILIGFICPGAILTAYVLALELFPSKRRAAASILLSSFNSVSYVGLAALAYFIKDWRHLQITISVLRIILVPLCWFVPESIQWLASKGKYEKLEEVLQRIATVNKIDVAFPILEMKKGELTDGATDYDEQTTSESDLPRKETGKSVEDLFMYDSAVSLDRDYIPAEDNYSLDNYSSESETEETTHLATSANLSFSSTSMSNLPSSRSSRNGLQQFPGHCEKVNVTSDLYRVNSSISILSELVEQNEMLLSNESLPQQQRRQPEENAIPLPQKELKQQPKLSVTKPLRKKSVSLCNIPTFYTYQSEIHQVDRTNIGNDLSVELNNSGFSRTNSIPNITVCPSEIATTGAAANPPQHKSDHRSKVNRKPPNLTLNANDQADSSYLLSVPTLALPFGFSQSLFPNIGAQYENMESTQSEETIEDDTSGFNSSTSNVGHLSDYDSLEEGFSRQPKRVGYTEITTTFDDKMTEKITTEKVKEYNAFDLFRMSSVRLVTISSMVLWFATYSVYVGLSMSSNALAGDPYINFSLVGLVEIPAVIVAAISAVRIGRRIPSGVFHFVTALSCFVYLLLPTDDVPTWASVVSVVAILLAKCFTSAAYNVECLLTAEVLPTPLRSVGIGLFVLCSRIGGVIVPFVLISGESSSKYPMMIFAALSVIAVLMLLPLPEMIGMPQPQTPDDVKRIRKLSKERKTSKSQPPVSLV